MTIRLIKALLVLQVGAFAGLVGYNNIVDYGSNFGFVEHVLGMQDVFPGNTLTGRAVAEPWMHHFLYWAIIAVEIGTGAACLAGGVVLIRARNAPAAEFERKKALAAAGLAAGFTLWFFGFIVVGGEWFQMWQSGTWNGQPSAFRFAACIALVLIVLLLPDREPGSGGNSRRG